jgi:hypothetical protein
MKANANVQFPKDMTHHYSHTFSPNFRPHMCTDRYGENDITGTASCFVPPMYFAFLIVVPLQVYLMSSGTDSRVYYLFLQHAFLRASQSHSSQSLPCYRASSKIQMITSHNVRGVKLQCTSAVSTVRAWPWISSCCWYYYSFLST